MTSPADRAATDRAATDPFWSVVRRRHPDVDLVLLPPVRSAPAPSAPPAPPAPPAPESPAADVEAEAAGEPGQLLDRARAAWSSYLPDVAPGPAVEERWIPGPERTRRAEVVLAADGVDPVAVAAALRSAAEELRGAGWHVLEPADGWPRVLAGRRPESAAAGGGREELHLMAAPTVAGGRVVLRLRGLPVAGVRR